MRMFDRSSAPVWLFSFVDLAFLLLVAVTQVVDGDPVDLPLGEFEVPQIRTEAAAPLGHDTPERWLVRVHPVVPDESGVFALGLGHQASAAALEALDLAHLGERLDRLFEQGTSKPLLAPHADARAADLLAAVALIEERWPASRRVTIAPVSGGPR